MARSRVPWSSSGSRRRPTRWSPRWAVAPDGKTADIVNGAKTVPMQTATRETRRAANWRPARWAICTRRRCSRCSKTLRARRHLHVERRDPAVAQPVPPDRSAVRRAGDMQAHGNAGGALGPPHIFAVADRAYALLRQGVAAQALVVNGESGAGKTESCRQLMRYISRASSAALARRPATAATAASPRSPGDGRGDRQRRAVHAAGLVRPGPSERERSATTRRAWQADVAPLLAERTLLGSRIQTRLIEKSRLCAG